MVSITLGLLKVAIKHTYIRSGVFHYQRAVPTDLRGRYKALRLKLNLNTDDPVEAVSKVEILDRKLEVEWDAIRSGLAVTPSKAQELAKTLPKSERRLQLIEFLRLPANKPNAVCKVVVEQPALESTSMPPSSQGATISELRDIYLANHKKGESSHRLVLDTERVVTALVKQCGDIPITQLSRRDATKFRDDLLSRGVKTATARRRIATASAIVASAIRELELDKKNPFQSMKITGEGRDADSKEVFTTADLQRVQSEAKKQDDDIRWLAAMHSDLGCRISDVAGLSINDINLNAEVPHVHFREDLARDRTLKTGGIGERKVPLIGVSLWAAERVVAEAKDNQIFAFPRYCTGRRVKGGSASAAINKWLSTLEFDRTYTTHSFRHSMADRLREVGCPEDIRKAIGGWAADDIAGTYGEGYSLRVMKQWLDKVILSAEK